MEQFLFIGNKFKSIHRRKSNLHRQITKQIDEEFLVDFMTECMSGVDTLDNEETPTIILQFNIKKIK